MQQEKADQEQAERAVKAEADTYVPQVEVPDWAAETAAVPAPTEWPAEPAAAPAVPIQTFVPQPTEDWAAAPETKDWSAAPPPSTVPCEYT